MTSKWVEDDPTTRDDGIEMVEGPEEVKSKTMDLLKDLPSYNSSNFSRFSSPGAVNGKNKPVSCSIVHCLGSYY